MKTTSTSTRWLGLALAAGALTFASSTEAAKPVKPPPPPPPPPAPAYNHYLLGNLGAGSGAWAINEGGLVVGSADLPATGETRPFLVVPATGPDGKWVWYSDANSDGFNDLMANLGVPPGAAPTDYFLDLALNDHGVILGNSNSIASEYQSVPWILAPQTASSGLSWTTFNADGVNEQMQPLPVFIPPPEENGIDVTEENVIDVMWVMTQGLNNHGEVALVIGSENTDEESFPDGWWQRGFLLLPSRYEVADGAVTVEYPVADANSDGINDHLISLGNGKNLSGYTKPLLVTAINDQGDVAGLVWDGSGGAVNGEHPFVLRPISVVDDAGNTNLVWYKDDDGDGLNDLVIYLPPGAAEVVSMNESGTLVGSARDRKGKKIPALWQVDWATRTVTFKSLGLLEGEERNYAKEVNTLGQVVGFGQTPWPAYSSTGWLWNQGTMSPLSTLVPTLSGNLYSATGINDSGMIVGGQQMTSTGVSTAFIVVPVTQP